MGLAFSAYTAPSLLSLIIAILTATDRFVNYLRLHKDVLYLSAAQIKTLRELLPLFYIVFVLLVLALLEMLR